jgi:hypothetical protein
VLVTQLELTGVISLDKVLKKPIEPDRHLGGEWTSIRSPGENRMARAVKKEKRCLNVPRKAVLDGFLSLINSV